MIHQQISSTISRDAIGLRHLLTETITQRNPKTDGSIHLIFTASRLFSAEKITICSTVAGPVCLPVAKLSSSRIRLYRSRPKCHLLAISTIGCSKGTTTKEQSVDLLNGTAARRSLARGKRRPSFTRLSPKRPTHRRPKRRLPFSHRSTAG